MQECPRCHKQGKQRGAAAFGRGGMEWGDVFYRPEMAISFRTGIVLRILANMLHVLGTPYIYMYVYIYRGLISNSVPV